jgi:hypothetical protein
MKKLVTANTTNSANQTDGGEWAGQMQKACEHMTRELVEGTRHGFFEMTVVVEMMQSRKRCITIKAGKSVRFVA